MPGYTPAGFPQLGDQKSYVTGEYDNIAKAMRSLKGTATAYGTRLTTLEADKTAWSAWTPTITPGSGAFTSATASGRYKQVGKVVFFSCRLTITTVGTADVSVDLSLPVTAQAALNGVFIGRENLVTGDLFIARVLSTTVFRIQGSVASVANYPHGNGYQLDFSGSYEAA